MSVIKVTWFVDDLTDVMADFDEQKVFRAPSTSGPWEEITGPGTRVTLAAGVVDYMYTDTTGSSSYYYAVSYFHSGTMEESDKSDPIRGDMAGYVSIDDVREEGFVDEDDFPDDRISRAIIKASKQIDRVTRRFFEPRELTIKLDGDGEDLLEFGIPLIAMLGLTVDGVDVPSSELVIYNRHLTQGLTEPDDRRFPKIEYKRLDPGLSWDGSFNEGQQNIVINGYFGYTELGYGDPAGETEAGSQVPLTYGDTPELIKSACLLLVVTHLFKIADGDAEEFRRRMSVRMMKTRDQSIEYSDNSDSPNEVYGNLTGDPVVDQMLASFVAPNPMMSV